MSIEDYMTIEDAAEYFSVAWGTVNRWTKEGVLDRKTVLGKSVLIRAQVDRLKTHIQQHPFDWRKSWNKEDTSRK